MAAMKERRSGGGRDEASQNIQVGLEERMWWRWWGGGG